ncbi:DUF1648 domain-containing protein [Paenibacillus fonticola]|uniref:DUF1648 domain-containing protein n=1 Tax=Paenibacillus fonticola TaxID=379896 RepID=UPI000378E763|nr:DUF5808 domain-containing protein [Paenibacillus fonticola]
MTLLFTLTFLFMFIPISALLAFMPYLTRETVSFGISISEEVFRSEPLRKMRKKYAVISLAFYIPIFIICIYVSMQSSAELQSVLFGVMICLIVIFSLALNITFYFNMKKLKASLPVSVQKKAVLAVDTSFHRQKLVLSNKWYIIHLILSLVSAAAALIYYDSIPEQIAMKFDLQGNIINSVAKSYVTVLYPNLMQLFIIALFIFVNWSIQRSKQQISPGNPEHSVRQNVAFRRRWSLFSILSGLTIVGLFSFIQLNMIHPLENSTMMFVSLLLPLFIVLFAIILSITIGQGGSRIGRSKDGSPVVPVNDDDYWKLGMFYYNPNDPSLSVEKRVGIGWTINFAHPGVWFILSGLIIVIAIGLFLGL